MRHPSVKPSEHSPRLHFIIIVCKTWKKKDATRFVVSLYIASGKLSTSLQSTCWYAVSRLSLVNIHIPIFCHRVSTADLTSSQLIEIV